MEGGQHKVHEQSDLAHRTNFSYKTTEVSVLLEHPEKYE